MEPQPTPWYDENRDIQEEEKENERNRGPIVDPYVIDIQPRSYEDDLTSDTESMGPIIKEGECEEDCLEKRRERQKQQQEQLGALCIILGAILVLIVVGALIFGGWVLFVIFGLPCIPCLSPKGRRRFLNCCMSVYVYCPLFGSVEEGVINVHDALKRYAEDIPEPKDVERQLQEDTRMLPIIESIEKNYPDLFFHFIPTGSLVEKFGKSVATSNSILASDYDIMLVPSGISVGKNEFDTFRPIKAPSGDGKIFDGFLWLDLNDGFLKQWEKFSLRRRIKVDDDDNVDENEANDNEVYRMVSREENFKEAKLLSTYMLKDAIRKGIEQSKDIKSHAGMARKDVNICVEDRGPALSVKITEWDKDLKCSWYKEKYWEADFTLGLRCTDWPAEVIDGFFKKERKWPGGDVIDRIQRYGCHLVPKPSADFRIKLHLNSESMYARSPGLEWRYSFSVAEYILSGHIPEPARIAFLGFKAMIKKYINSPLKKGNIDLKISSFSLKCILYRLLESKEEYWFDCDDLNELVERTYDELFEKLIEELEKGECPNFWLPGINLFEELKREEGKHISDEMLEQLRRLQGTEGTDKMSFLVDPWLECARCIYLNGCFCAVTPGICCIEPDTTLESTKTLKIPDVKPCIPLDDLCGRYNEDTCPCDGCVAWKKDFHVY